MRRSFRPKLSFAQWNKLKKVLDRYNLELKKNTGRPKSSDKSVILSLLWLIYEQGTGRRGSWNDIPKYKFYAKKTTAHDRFILWTSSDKNVFSHIWSIYINTLSNEHRAWLRKMIIRNEMKLKRRGFFKHIKF